MIITQAMELYNKSNSKNFKQKNFEKTFFVFVFFSNKKYKLHFT